MQPNLWLVDLFNRRRSFLFKCDSNQPNDFWNIDTISAVVRQEFTPSMIFVDKSDLKERIYLLWQRRRNKTARFGHMNNRIP